MSITVELTVEQARRLHDRARELGVDVQELVTAAVTDLLSRPADDFVRAARFVLEKNQELYRRFS
jgi:hypothetical protein